MESNTVLEARDLTKKYGERTAVNKISLRVSNGECLGLLGPIGSGKSSTLKMIYGGATITEGELYVLGLNVKKQIQDVKARIGVVPQEVGLDSDFSVLENLMTFSEYFRIDHKTAYSRSRELIRFMHLEDYLEDTVESLSIGMKRRLAVARSLINNPQLLVLDEPTTGLDYHSRIWIWDRLRDLKEMGTTIILTTHNMEEAERLCDRIAIMNHGKIVCEDGPSELVKSHVGSEIVEFFCDPKDFQYFISRVKSNYDYQVFENSIRLYIRPEQDGKTAIQSLPSNHLMVRKSSLEDVFLKLTGNQLR